MKKLLSLGLVFVMLMTFGVTALAEGGFVNSPSLNPAPEAEGSSKVVITPYSERDSLTEAERKALEEAYDSINEAENLADLNKDLKGDNLAVSDLFNVGANGADASGTHDLTLKSDTFNNFVALMTYVNGEWKIVDGAKLQNGHLVFTAKHFGPYAVVVNTGDDTKSPQTGINETVQNNGTALVVYGALALASAFGALLMWKKSKKYSA